MEKLSGNIILSADDFGKNPAANKNILDLIRLNKLQRVAVFTNGTFTPDEIKALLNSGVKIDIHLDTSSQADPNRKIYKNLFLRGLQFLLQYFSGKISVGITQLEWEKQVQKFQDIFGKKPDGLNSHQHIHFFPAYFPIAIQLAKKFEIPYVRFGEKDIFKKGPISRILGILHKKDFKNFASSGLESSAFVASLDWLKKDLPGFWAKLSSEKIEIVCHPERKNEFVMIKKYF